MSESNTTLQPISQEEYSLCIDQCRAVKEANNEIVELAQRILTSEDSLTERHEQYLKNLCEAGDDLRKILDELLELAPSQWNYNLVGDLRNELHMRANNVAISPYVLLELDRNSIDDRHKADLQEMVDKAFDMMSLIQRLGRLGNDED